MRSRVSLTFCLMYQRCTSPRRTFCLGVANNYLCNQGGSCTITHIHGFSHMQNRAIALQSLTPPEGGRLERLPLSLEGLGPLRPVYQAASSSASDGSTSSPCCELVNVYSPASSTQPQVGLHKGWLAHHGTSVQHGTCLQACMHTCGFELILVRVHALPMAHAYKPACVDLSSCCNPIHCASPCTECPTRHTQLTPTLPL